MRRHTLHTRAKKCFKCDKPISGYVHVQGDVTAGLPPVGELDAGQTESDTDVDEEKEEKEEEGEEEEEFHCEQPPRKSPRLGKSPGGGGSRGGKSPRGGESPRGGRA